MEKSGDNDGIEILLGSSLDTARYADEIENLLGDGILKSVAINKFLKVISWMDKKRVKKIRRYISPECMVKYLVWMCCGQEQWYYRHISCKEAEKHLGAGYAYNNGKVG